MDRYSEYFEQECCVERYFEKETLTRGQIILETLMLGLRQEKGVDLHHMLYFLKGDEKKKFLCGVELLKSQSLIQESGGKIYLTLKGMVLENEVILRLF